MPTAVKHQVNTLMVHGRMKIWRSPSYVAKLPVSLIKPNHHQPAQPLHHHFLKRRWWHDPWCSIIGLALFHQNKEAVLVIWIMWKFFEIKNRNRWESFGRFFGASLQNMNPRNVINGNPVFNCFMKHCSSLQASYSSLQGETSSLPSQVGISASTYFHQNQFSCNTLLSYNPWAS